MKATLVKYIQLVRNARADQAYRKSTIRPNGYDRMYHVHVRKSAGTSINAAFWKKVGYDLSTVKRKTQLIGNGLVCVRNNKKGIEAGNYFYANSHAPYWSLTLPEKTYTFCVLRDPLARLMSLYRYYHWVQNLDETTARQSEPYYDSLMAESACVKGGFDSFLDLADKSHLCNQLYMFSENYDSKEAIERCSELSDVFFQDSFNAAMNRLKEVSGLELEILHERKSGNRGALDITNDQSERVNAMLRDSYAFYNAMRKLKS